MKIKDMFTKKIDREIQGVIIVGQGEDVNVSQELEEYVVTRELQKHFADFYSAYKKGIVGTTPKMGVWISGFFGSGKSHFLKILSYLLENRQVGDRKAMEYFVDDKKIVDPMVLADMKLAAEIPTDVILFNIDSKSETNGKQNKDAIVNVFLKVFNQMQGFCGSIPHVADLERRLSEEGRFDEFKAAFEEEYGELWEDSRQDFDFIQDSVVDALVSMDFMSEAAARNWCEKAAEPYTISIEDFAKRVRTYIERKGNNHHVVFLVDEIGQYFFTTVSKRRDDFFDFAEDYEPIKTFFEGEQSTIFARALDMLAIYDDSKTYIVNDELENIVAQMRSITRQEKPYANIPKLPELRERFMSCYVKILQQESAPVLDSIDQARKRVLEVLSTKEYNEQKRTAYFEKFQEIRDGATHCNNVSTLRSYADKADALKLRLLNEMDELDRKLAKQKAEEEARRQAEEAKQSGKPAPEVTVAPAPVKIRKTKNVSIKMMTGTSSWRLESKEDIARYMDSLRKTLEAQLDDDTIVNVEF